MYSDPTGHAESASDGSYPAGMPSDIYNMLAEKKKAADDQHKWKTMEKMGAAQIKSKVLLPNSANIQSLTIITATGKYQMPWSDLGSDKGIMHREVQRIMMGYFPILIPEKSFYIPEDKWDVAGQKSIRLDLYNTLDKSFYEIKPISYQAIDSWRSEELSSQLSLYKTYSGATPGSALGVYLNQPTCMLNTTVNIYSEVPGEIFYTFTKYKGIPVPAPSKETAEEYETRKAREKLLKDYGTVFAFENESKEQVQVPFSAQQPAPVYNIDAFTNISKSEPVILTMTGEKYTPIEKFFYDVSNNINDSYNEFHDSVFGINGGGSHF